MSSTSPKDEVYVHRLVQDENAKTILLNVPIEAAEIMAFKPPFPPRPKTERSTSMVAPSKDLPRPRRNLRESAAAAATLKGKRSQRIRSASVGRDRRSDMQARYWAFLFENLRRAVDDLYTSCEADGHIPGTKEVILVLENYVRDFRNLVDWLKLKWDYENTPPPQRPTSLAWEVRKTSPAAGGAAAKMLTPSKAIAAAAQQRLLMASPARRMLNFEEEEQENNGDDAKEKGEEEQLAENDEKVTQESVNPLEEKENEDPTMTAEPIADKEAQSVTSGPVPGVSNKKPQTTTRTSAAAAKTAVTAVTGTGSVKSAASSASSSSGNSSVRSRVSSSTTTVEGSKRGASSGARMAKTTTANQRSASATKGSNNPAAKTTTATAAAQPRKKTDSTSSPKVQRISLVARQSFAAAAGKASKVNRNGSGGSNPLLTRSATTANISRPSSARPTSGTARPLRTTQPSAVQSKPPVTKRSSLPPFGSSSSISSSGSSRSWADTVKGLKAPRSVEDLTKNNKAGPNAEAAKTSNTSTSGNLNQNEDEDGWETVRPRARSKYSPVSECSSGKRPPRVRHSNKTRFQTPSSAISLPTLAFMKEEDNNAVSEGSSNSPPNKLRGLSESKAKDEDKTKTDAVKEESNNSGDNAAIIVTEEASEKNKTEPEEQEDEEEDEEERSTDSAIAKLEEGIAKSQLEEDALIKAIRETEQEELRSEDGESVASVSTTTTSVASGGDQLGYVDAAAAALSADSKRYEKMMESLSWADQLDLEEEMAGAARYPGRMVHLHEKLSSPSRKKEPEEAFKRHQEKQRKAKLRRDKFQDDKASKLSLLNAKIAVVIAEKKGLMDERRFLLDDKMLRAEKKREEFIEGIRRKAHEEDAKLKEIAFINELQARNARVEQLAHSRDIEEKHEERLAELAEERARRYKEREAKEAKAHARRKDMEDRRLRKMEETREKIRTREERIQEEQEATRREREEAARERNRDREEKLSSVRAAEEGLKAELHLKIHQKQTEAARRHEEKLERVRAKAFELSVLRCSAGDDCTDGHEQHVPLLKAYERKKKCEICKVFIVNEVQLQSHLRGKRHCDAVQLANNGRKLSGEEIQSCNLRHIVDARPEDSDPRTVRAKERTKAMKKRSKKIKARMASRTANFARKLAHQPPPSNKPVVDSPNLAKIGKSIRDIEKLLGSQGKSSWQNNSITMLERSLGEISRALEKGNSKADRDVFNVMRGFSVLNRIFLLVSEQKTSCVIPTRSVISSAKAFGLACRGHQANTACVVMSNFLTTVVDVLHDRLLILVPSTDASNDGSEDNNPGGDGMSDCGSVNLKASSSTAEPEVDALCKALLDMMAQCLEDLTMFVLAEGKTVEQSGPDDLNVRVQDEISYIVAIGVVDQLAAYLSSVMGQIDSSPALAAFLLSVMQFLSALTGVAEVLVKAPAKANVAPSDPTHLLQTFQVTDLAGTVSMLYGMLLHQDAPMRDEKAVPPKLPPHTTAVAQITSQLLYRVVRQHLSMVQDVLGQEGISLEFRHIASYLLWYCQHYKEERELLHLVIILVGYFSALRPDNQAIVQSGHQPSVLQQLCNLPINYFSQPELKRVLFPTLLAACRDNEVNTGVLTEEMSFGLLREYVESEEGKENHLVQLANSK